VPVTPTLEPSGIAAPVAQERMTVPVPRFSKLPK
jgi:hypothetical protein